MTVALAFPPAGLDPNGAGWFALRYRSDFVGWGAAPGVPLWQQPVLEPELFYDDGRHVLELRPAPPAHELDPLPGLAVDLTGEVYLVSADGVLLRGHCDRCEAPLLCEPGVLSAPAGLALDRRGFLYIADPAAGRVVVVSPDDGSVVAVLADGLQEPVDVAVAPSGTIYVADRQGAEISVWTARFKRTGSFASGLVNFRPIAVFAETGGVVGAVDAAHPRVLRFGADGSPLPDAEWSSITSGLGDPDLVLGALRCIYGPEPVRVVAGACLGPCPVPDGAERLVAAHRALRLLRLRLAHQFETSGTFVSAALDGGRPGAVWHKLELEADLPPGTWLELQTVTSDDPTRLNVPNALQPGLRFVPEPSGANGSPRLPPGVLDRLILSPPGRYLRLRLTLGGVGRATPSVRLVRVLVPRVSYLDLLPRVFRRDPDAEQFLERFLALFEHLLTRLEARYEAFSRELNLDAAPGPVLDWLASLLDVAFEPSWPLERRRAYLREAVWLYRIRGTPAGIARALELYTGRPPILVEHWLDRPAMRPALGRAGYVLGLGTLGPAVDAVGDAGRAHRFTVYVESDDPALDETLLAMARRIVDTTRPAHTSYDIRVLRAGATVGDGRVGFDLILGGRQAPGLALGGCEVMPPGLGAGATLGVDAVLGSPRPDYAAPFGQLL
jgi:phage tail-like protein